MIFIVENPSLSFIGIAHSKFHTTLMKLGKCLDKNALREEETKYLKWIRRRT
jgi:hypothetical protein